MAQTLIVSNPPQEDPDLISAAPHFGLSAAEIRMKANYPVPEIWLADADAAKMEATATELRNAALSVVAVRGEDLAAVPAALPVKSFAFADAGLTAQLEDSEVHLAFDAPLTAVFCQPRAMVSDEMARSTDSLTEGLVQRRSGMFMARDSLVGFSGTRVSSAEPEADDTPSPFLDVYVARDDELQRISFAEDTVDFSGLGELALPRASDNMVMFVAEFEDRFPAVGVDRRLVGMQPRMRQMVHRHAELHGERKGFSFATQALSQLLDSISGDLKDLNQFELASRLAYLTKR